MSNTVRNGCTRNFQRERGESIHRVVLGLGDNTTEAVHVFVHLLHRTHAPIEQVIEPDAHVLGKVIGLGLLALMRAKAPALIFTLRDRVTLRVLCELDGLIARSF
ncbi:MAG TPA: hypothetical protein VGM90_36155 [Kofleriaceae bacterium]